MPLEDNVQLNEDLAGAAAPAPAADDPTSTPAPTPVPAPVELDERLSAMDQIAAANLVRMEEDQRKHNEANGIAPAPSSSPTPEPTPAPTPAPADQLAQQLAEEPKVLSDDELANIRVKVVVDGEERIVTGLEAKASAGKKVAIDKRLAEANQLLKDVRRVTSTPATPPVGNDGAPAPSNTPAVPAPAGADFEKVGMEFVTAMFDGDDKKALEALTKVLGGRPNEGTIPTEAELIAKLTPQVKQQLAVERALDEFVDNYADVATDPYLAKVVDDNLKRIVKEDPDKSFSAALKEAGDATRGWLQSKGVAAPVATPAPSPSSPPTTPRAEKLERKQSAQQVTGLNARASSTEPPPQTTSDVIAEMRLSRGMPA